MLVSVPLPLLCMINTTTQIPYHHTKSDICHSFSMWKLLTNDFCVAKSNDEFIITHLIWHTNSIQFSSLPLSLFQADIYLEGMLEIDTQQAFCIYTNCSFVFFFLSLLALECPRVQFLNHINSLSNNKHMQSYSFQEHVKTNNFQIYMFSSRMSPLDSN